MPTIPSNLAAVQRRLGVELPESYVAALEDYGLAGVKAYKFYGLDELGWFTDHPLAVTVPYEGRALVIAEDAAGNAVVLLGFNVAGKPVLSDEVYLIDHEFGEPEELAMDLIELLERVGGAPVVEVETLWETAFDIAATRRKTVAALTDALQARGYSDALEQWDAGGSFLRVSLFGDGPVVLWVRTEEPTLWLARRLAVLLKRPISAYEVAVRDEAVKDDNEEYGFPFKARSLDVRPDGTMADRETGLMREVANHGDAYETAMTILWDLVDRPDGTAETLEFYRAAPPADLSPRLAGILTAIAESDSVGLTEVAGQQAVRIELPDGTRQLSVLTNAELATLRQHTDI